MTTQKLIDELTQLCHEGYAQSEVYFDTAHGIFGIQHIELKGKTIEFTDGKKNIVQNERIILS